MRIVLALLIAVAAPPSVFGAVDPGKRNEEFRPKSSDQPRVDKERVEVGASHPVRDGEVQFVTVPAADARAPKLIVLERERAPVSVTGSKVAINKPERAVISTADGPPGKFTARHEAKTVARIQESMSEANRIKAGKTKAAAKPSVIERINRFVFRKNEPAPAATPAGGDVTPADDPPAESPSSGS